MTHYSNNPGHVRIDQFKPGGKWYQTVQGDMSEYYGLPDDPTHKSYMLIDWAVALVIAQQFPSVWKDAHETDYDWWFLVQEPFHRK